MSTKFDWSQFEEANPQEKSTGFDWSQFEVQEKRPSKVEGMKREFGRTAKVIGSTLAGLPGDVAESVQKIPQYLQEKITGNKISQSGSGLLRALTPGGQLPRSEEIKSGVESFAPSLAPTSDKEKEDEENLSLLTSLLIPGPGGKGKAAKALADPVTASKIYKAGKAMGLSAKQLTPLFQSPGKASFLGKFAKNTGALKKSFEMTEGALSDVYSGIKDKASRLPKMDAKDTEKLVEKFVDLKVNLQKTLKAAPDKQAAINFIDEAIEKANNFGASPEELINTFQDINSAVNWNAIRGGKKVLAQLKAPIMESLRKTSPKIAKEFENTNELWSRMRGIQKQIGLPKIEKYLEYGKWASILGSLVFGNVKGAAMTAAASFVWPKVATKMLTDPKWQNLQRRAIHSIKRQDKNLGFKTFQMLKEKMKKDMPQEYEEIDWDEFLQES